MRRLIMTATVTTFIFSSAFVYAVDSNNSEKNSQQNHVLLAQTPPGLAKKGVGAPPSLGNTPPGWDEGLKKGWNKDKNWHWNKKNKTWENKHWRWDANEGRWEENKGWGKEKHH